MAQLDQELDRINRLLRQISQVTDYVTKPYAQGLQIIDLEAAHGAEAGPPNPDKE
jgi:hypothetical protein